MQTDSPARWRRALILLAVLALSAPGTTLWAQGQSSEPRGHPAMHRPEVPGVNGLVTGGSPLATMAGARMLLQGGNAFDAAVAVGAVLNVVRPEMSGAGGNAFFTLYDRQTDRVYALNATGAAPLALRVEAITPDDLLEGVKAGIVPGTFGGWISMLQRFGTMSLADVLAPAIEYAQEGFPIEPGLIHYIEERRGLFERFPDSRAQFLPEGRLPRAHERFRMPALASTFRKVAEAEQAALAQGRSREEALQAAFDRFYTGDIAREIDRFHREHDGLIRLEDLARYQPIWADPVRTTYRGYEIYSSPSTSRGGFEVVMGLNLLEPYDMKSLGAHGAEALHLIAEAIKVSKSDIYHYVADPAFVEIPVSWLTSKDYARERGQLIQRDRAIAFPARGTPPGGDETGGQAAAEGRVQLAEEAQVGSTDSYSVADRWGNVVAATPTHGSAFGTGVVVGSTGLTLNNGMRIGSTSPYPDQANYPEPGKIPILNNSPTVVFQDGRFLLALGTPGGEQIGQAQFQVLVNILDFGMSIQEAIEAPRFWVAAAPNFYRPNADITINLENRVSSGVVEALRRKGHAVQLQPGFALGQNMQGIYMNLETGTMIAGADPRRSGYAVGF